MSENGHGCSAQKRFSGDGDSGAAVYKVWKRWARAALVVKKVGEMPPEGVRPWIYTFLDGQAESIDIKDMCTEGGEELVFIELYQRFPDKVAAGRMGEAMEEAFWAKKIEKKRDDGGFHWTVETCVYPSSVRRCEIAVRSSRVHCFAWMSAWKPGSSNDHVCNPHAGAGSLMV